MARFRVRSVHRGATSFLWGLFFGGYVGVGLLAVGATGVTSGILGAMSGAASFLFVRIRGDDVEVGWRSTSASSPLMAANSMTQAAPRRVRPQFDPTQEVRFAVVLYGGVSLAIYINGIVQELLHLVRATAPEQPSSRSPTTVLLHECVDGSELEDQNDLRGTEAVYRRLGQMVRLDDAPDLRAGAETPVRTRFVVDILSGTSAGGINAIFLAKALANGQSLEQVRRLWIEDADLAELINDRRSRIDGFVREQKPPQSLLNSKRMYWKLLEALTDMADSSRAFTAEESPFVDELDCWITTTDIQGLELPIQLFDRLVYERRYKNVFRFLYRTAYAAGEEQNDLVDDNNPFLAFAARCTASFPFTFVPMVLTDIDGVVGQGRFARYRDAGSAATAWERFYPDYRRAAADPNVSVPQPFPNRAFGDGGYLDNKPFTWATQSVERRRSDWPVDRRLLYLEPDPERLQPEPMANQAAGQDRPDAIQNVRAALSLPRVETIREDLAALRDRNRAIARLERLTAVVDRTVEEIDPDDPNRGGLIPALVTRTEVDAWRKKAASELFQERGVLYASYYRIKLASALDEFAKLVGRHLLFDPESDEVSAIRCVIQAWFETRYPETGTGTRSQNDFLFCLDLGYRQRRLTFLLRRVDRVLGLKPEQRANRGLASSDAEWDDFRKNLLHLRRDLNDLYVQRRALARDAQTPASNPRVTAALHKIEVTPAELATLLTGTTSFGESVGRARELINRRALQEPLDRAAATIARELSSGLRSAARREREALDAAVGRAKTSTGPAAAQQREELARLGRIVDYYESYDAVTFPITYAKIGEADQVKITRISPLDATSLINELSESRHKLSGAQIHHFGGFFKESWRRNDMMWGRLDAAERLIDSLLPTPDPPDPELVATKQRLLEQAQRAIITEEFDLSERGELGDALATALLSARAEASQSDTSILTAVEPQRVRRALASTASAEAIRHALATTYSADRTLDPHTTFEEAGRSMRVVGLMFDGLSDRYSILKSPARWLTRIGRLAWGLAEVTTQDSIKKVIAHYWLSLLILISIVMIVGGALLGSPATTKAGWTALLITVVVKLLIWVSEDAFRGQWAPTTLLATAAALAVFGLAALEAAAHFPHDLNVAVSKLPHALHRFDPWFTAPNQSNRR
jgi:patatin-related protein